MLPMLLLATALSIEDYATMNLPASPRWSPDGTRIAYVVTSANLERSVYEADVWLVGADGSGNLQLTHEGNDTQPRWSPDGKRVAFLSDRNGPNQLYVIGVAGGEARQLTKEPTAIRTFDWAPDGRSIAFTRLDEPSAEEQRRAKERDDARVVGENKRHAHLHVINDAGDARRVTRGDFSVITMSWMPDGASIVFDRAPGLSLDDLYRTDIYSASVADGTLKPIVVREGLDRGPLVSPDGRWIAFTSTGTATDAWISEHDVHVVPASGGASRVLSKSYGRTPESITWSDDSRTVWFDGPWNTTSQLFRVNVDGSGFADTTGVSGMIADADVHGERAAFVYQSLTEPPEVYVGTRRVTNHNAKLRDRLLGETRVIRWKHPNDGLEIEALLTLPVGYKAGQRVPLLTFVHGGPASHFAQGFLGYLGPVYAPQVLAARGFAVLRPNPRGSGGYGVAFRRANVRDWAEGPWSDVEAGIDKLIADGIADPQRLGLMGWSYGGYLAAWALGHSDRFRAVSIGGAVTDLLSDHLTADIHDYIPAYFDMRALDVLRAQSPLWNLKKTHAKVLIQHGENDERVPLAQSTMLYQRLRELGADVTMVVYPRSAHVPREPKLRMDVMRRNVELFDGTLR
ncbi:MAG TPA: S9 family peptidase [Thermoanaerobaculia bacterium]|nr:S9 family peptidase [Thermoanaerobaculia bacterium]